MIKVAIIGLGFISHRVAKGIQFANNATLYAVASRDLKKAEEFKNQYQASVAYGCYEDLLLDEQVDMVYICTPNHLHYEHIQLCLRHHKHVLCEKPLVSTSSQLHECFAYARKQHCFLMEAEKTLFTPLNQKIKQMVNEGCIGTLQYVEGSYGYLLDEQDVPTDFWGYRQEDGGSAYDVGVYPICYANYFAGANIASIQVMKTCADKGYDVFMQSLVTYDNKVQASVRSAWNMNMKNQAYLYGTKGCIVTENFWKNTEAYLFADGKKERIQVVMDSDFTGEVEHAAMCIEQGRLQSEILSEHHSAQIMRILEAVKES